MSKSCDNSWIGNNIYALMKYIDSLKLLLAKFGINVHDVSNNVSIVNEPSIIDRNDYVPKMVWIEVLDSKVYWSLSESVQSSKVKWYNLCKPLQNC